VIKFYILKDKIPVEADAAEGHKEIVEMCRKKIKK